MRKPWMAGDYPLPYNIYSKLRYRPAILKYQLAGRAANGLENEMGVEDVGPYLSTWFALHEFV